MITTPNPAQRKSYRLMKVVITAGITCLIVGWLLWAHFHAGVGSHFILQNKDLPEISNWWGGLLLPVLTWLLLGTIEKRLARQETDLVQPKEQQFKILGLFLLGLLLGVSIAIAFAYDYKPFLDNVLYIILLLSLLVPIYFAEFILGFILGMTYTFGVVLPTIFMLVCGAIGFLLYRFIRPLLLRLPRLLRK
jgi:hypothetical protein